ncbi:MAG: glycerophosphodiester phosphodiesterase [Bacillales bacterium]|jgi:glycerophosphoryl diester phosphodiesterase|nr:glycerophosphodiester phosphodiesterase [Bacillales bacterium]
MTLIFAHRGFSMKYPENSMLAFKKAAEVGADGIELDVHLSKDKVPIVIHDETIDRTTHKNGYVKDYTSEELKKVHKSKSFFKKDLEPIPTLDEVLNWIVNSNLFLNIEIKNDNINYEGIEQIIIDMVKKYKMEERVILSSFNHCSLETCKKTAPTIDTAVLYNENMFQPWNYAKSLLASAIHPNRKFTSDELIHNSQKNDVAVRPWTVNKPQTMRKFFEENCAGIITDDPELAFKIRSTSK